MTFKQWWDRIEWSFSARILFKPIGQLFAEMAWNAAVKAEQDRCCAIIFSQCGSDNVAQRTVDAIRGQA
jgi:hypothetical protein